MPVLRSVFLVAAVLSLAPRGHASLGRLPRPQVHFALERWPYARVVLPGVDLSALAKADSLRALRARREAELRALRRRWSDELVVEASGYWQAIDRFLPAARLRPYQDALRAARGRASAAFEQIERETAGRFAAELGKLARESEAALQGLAARLAHADRVGEPGSALYLRARVSLERAGLASKHPERTALEGSAIADLERMAIAVPDHRLVRFARLHLAELLRARGRPTDALVALHPLLCKADSPERDAYRRCPAPARPDPLLEHGWFLVGELQLPLEPERAAAAHQLAIASGDSRSSRHAAALFQSGLAHFRLDRSELAARQLDRLLQLPERRGSLAALRAPALELLALVYGDHAWEGRMEPRTPRVTLRAERKGGRPIYRLEHQEIGITVEEALANLDRRYRGRRDPFLPELYLRVARLYCDSARHVGCATIARQVLDRWPLDRLGVEAIELLLRALEGQRLGEQVDTVIRQLAGRFAPGSAWRRANPRSAPVTRGLRRWRDRLRDRVLHHLALHRREPHACVDLDRAIDAALLYLEQLGADPLAKELRRRRASSCRPRSDDPLQTPGSQLGSQIRLWIGTPRPTPAPPVRPVRAILTVIWI